MSKRSRQAQADARNFAKVKKEINQPRLAMSVRRALKKTFVAELLPCPTEVDSQLKQTIAGFAQTAGVANQPSQTRPIRREVKFATIPMKKVEPIKKWVIA